MRHWNSAGATTRWFISRCEMLQEVLNQQENKTPDVEDEEIPDGPDVEEEIILKLKQLQNNMEDKRVVEVKIEKDMMSRLDILKLKCAKWCHVESAKMGKWYIPPADIRALEDVVYF